MTTDPTDHGVARILSRSKLLKGFTPLELGAAPDPAEMTAEELGEYDDDLLEELAKLTLEERELRLQQARLLAGALWTASVIMVDHLFEDLKTVSRLDNTTTADIDSTWILVNLPRRFAHRYGPLFVQKFIVVTIDLTTSLARAWRAPDCVAGELALQCLLEEVQTVVELYNLDLQGDWRARLEDLMVEDFDYDMLYDNSLDGFEDDNHFMSRFRITPMRWGLVQTIQRVLQPPAVRPRLSRGRLSFGRHIRLRHSIGVNVSYQARRWGTS